MQKYANMCKIMQISKKHDDRQHETI